MSNEFIERINTNFARQISTVPGKWTISDQLRDKVTEDGRFKPFYGYTSVFRLSPEDREKCFEVQKKLFADGRKEMFVPLPEKTFHVTAHEYANVYTVKNDKGAIDKANETVWPGITGYFSDLYRGFQDRKITLRALGPSTSGSDVVSLKFAPVSDEDAALLSNVFDRAEAVWPVGRTYTPHVSLGYFRLEEFELEKIRNLYSAITEIALETNFLISFKIGDLVFQRHFDMQDFRGLFTVSDSKPGFDFKI